MGASRQWWNKIVEKSFEPGMKRNSKCVMECDSGEQVERMYVTSSACLVLWFALQVSRVDDLTVILQTVKCNLLGTRPIRSVDSYRCTVDFFRLSDFSGCQVCALSTDSLVFRLDA